MSNGLIHFLIVFDHSIGELVSAKSFVESDEASLAYTDAEKNNRANRDIEIVLIGADSIETIHKTHGHYFSGSPLVSKYLQGV